MATKIPLRAPPPLHSTPGSAPEARLSPVSLKWEVHCPHLLHAGQTTSHVRKRLLSLFSEVIQNELSVLVLEDLDHAMPHVSNAQEQAQENQLARPEVGAGEGGGRNVRGTLPLLFVFYPPCIITIVKSGLSSVTLEQKCQMSVR